MIDVVYGGNGLVAGVSFGILREDKKNDLLLLFRRFNDDFTIIIMADYWKSQSKKFCDFCKCWIADNKPSVEFHENGKRHKENVAQRLKQISRQSLKDHKEKLKVDEDLKKMEKAALQAYLRDVESNADYTSQLLNKELNAEKSKQGNSSSFVECDTCLAKECEDNLEAWKAKEWYEAVSDEGYKYFWNTLSGESVWEPPAQGYISIDEQKKAESKEVEKLSKNKEKEDIRRKEEEIRKRKEEEKAKKEEERARSEREKMKSIAVKDNPEPPRTFFGPAPKGNPYGLWTTIKAKRNEPVDLQLPQQGHTFKASETVISEPEVKFKEKNFSNMQVEGNDTFFKKRKWNSNTKRNMRRRLDD